jgi:hypothetical protein
MNLYNVKNIKDLPELEQILPGNFIVVENFTGTNKLDFDNFVVGPRNTSFANQVFTDIYNLSTFTNYVSSVFKEGLSGFFENPYKDILPLVVKSVPYVYKNTFSVGPDATLIATIQLPTTITSVVKNSDIKAAFDNSSDVKEIYLQPNAVISQTFTVNALNNTRSYTLSVIRQDVVEGNKDVTVTVTAY